MSTNLEKIYCYVDETGQDTLGKMFLVAVVLIMKERDQIENRLLEIEHASKKGTTKWHKASHMQREKYIESIGGIRELRGGFYYSIYQNTILFADLVALTTAKAILDKAPDNYSASIVIDGLGRNLEKHFAASLRKLKIKTSKVKGARDESSVFIRLADAMAGLLRDANENKTWAKTVVSNFEKRGFVHEI